VYAVAEIERALELLASGLSYSETSRRLGISRAALRRWREEGPPRAHTHRRAGGCLRCSEHRFPIPRAADYSYAYLLGLYLGDGSISRHPRGVFRLRIYLDRAYPRIVGECVAAISIVVPLNRVTVIHAPDVRMDVPSAFSRHWPCLFPQHGPGMKHERSIALEPWRREIVDRHPWRLLRGLIHSDGSRHLNTIRHPKKTYRYPRYEFSNRSQDIRGLFCEYCDFVGVRWTQTNRWNISVARRGCVAAMDRHIGPKR
jgi:hypothetical protein